jgi:hypothetical protein
VGLASCDSTQFPSLYAWIVNNSDHFLHETAPKKATIPPWRNRGNQLEIAAVAFHSHTGVLYQHRRRSYFLRIVNFRNLFRPTTAKHDSSIRSRRLRSTSLPGADRMNPWHKLLSHATADLAFGFRSANGMEKVYRRRLSAQALLDLPGSRKPGVTESRWVIWAGRILGADVCAKVKPSARQTLTPNSITPRSRYLLNQP